ncbi:CvpA family protein [Candidatus Gottesmanbacteria bacterium]|nr:CvpA family protein [Candidatus Gottesmanbacteria bacterium]
MTLPLNWVDWIILAAIFYFLVDGWQAGLVSLVESLLAFLGSLWLSIKYHALVGNFLVEKFGIPQLWSSVVGYIIVGFVADIVIREVLTMLIGKLPKKLVESKTNQWLGSIVSGVNGIILVTFVLLLVTALPIRGTVKNDIRQSTVGKQLLLLANRYAGQVKSTLDEATKEALKFITVQPTSKERIVLDVTPGKNQLSIDNQAEVTMLELLNKEREKVGAPLLVIDSKITQVARLHSRDMFERKYFSHITPEGKDAGDRLQAGGVAYEVAGENLAYAPDVNTAHHGLMNSEGHRKNILDPQFHHIGIGVIDGGVYGKMFVQNFTD